MWGVRVIGTAVGGDPARGARARRRHQVEDPEAAGGAAADRGVDRDDADLAGVGAALTGAAWGFEGRDSDCAELGDRALDDRGRVFDQAGRQFEVEVAQVAGRGRDARAAGDFAGQVEVHFGVQCVGMGAGLGIGFDSAFGAGRRIEAAGPRQEAEFGPRRSGQAERERRRAEHQCGKRKCPHRRPPWRCFRVACRREWWRRCRLRCLALWVLAKCSGGLPLLRTKVPGVGSSGGEGSG
jgi:hypothetical protein